MTLCKHTDTIPGRERCYTGSVSRDANPMAHGGITYRERCRECGAERAVNQNGRHFELGEWGSSAKARQNALRTRAKVVCDAANVLAGERLVADLDFQPYHWRALISTEGREVWYTGEQLEAASLREDNPPATRSLLGRIFRLCEEHAESVRHLHDSADFGGAS